MEKSLLSLLSIALFANQAASVPAGVTPVLPVKRALPYYTGADTAAPYFIGYTYDGDWTALDCYLGATLSLSGDYGGCIPQGSTAYGLAKSCVSGSIQAVAPGVSSTCSNACATVLLFPNLDGLNPTTFIPCDATLYTASIYRATTHSSTASITPAATSSIPSQTASTTSSSSQSSSTTSSASSSSDSSNNNGKNIGLGVGLGVGLPLILAGIAALWYFQYRRHRNPAAAAAAVATSGPNDSTQPPGYSAKELASSVPAEKQAVSNAPPGFQPPSVHEMDNSTRPNYELDNSPRPNYEIDSNPRAELY